MTTLLDKIRVINSLAVVSYPIRPQSVFHAAMTVSYDNDEPINRLAGELNEFWRDGEFRDDDVELLTENAIVGIMASKLNMEEKGKLCSLVLKWFELVKPPGDVSASIIQSLLVTRFRFNEIYKIRLGMWNFIRNKELNSQTILEVSAEGKLVLNLRDRAKFSGNSVNEYVFLMEKSRELNRETNKTGYHIMRQYDYAACQEGELAEPLCNYQTSGYNPEKLEKPSYFCGNFYNSFLRHQKILEQIERNKRENWAENNKEVKYLSPIKRDVVDEELREKKEWTILSTEDVESDEYTDFLRARNTYSSSSDLSNTHDSDFEDVTTVMTDSVVFNMESLAIRVRE